MKLFRKKNNRVETNRDDNEKIQKNQRLYRRKLGEVDEEPIITPPKPTIRERIKKASKYSKVIMGIVVVMAIILARGIVTGDIRIGAKTLDTKSITPKNNISSELATSLLLLEYYNKKVTPDQFTSKYLVKSKGIYKNKEGKYEGENPWKVFIGNPKDNLSIGSNAEVMETALNKFLVANGYDGRAKTIYKTPIEELASEYIKKNSPIIIWGTENMTEPDEVVRWKLVNSKQMVEFKKASQCYLLIGEDFSNYYFYDHVKGQNKTYSKRVVKNAYEKNGAQAIVLIEPKRK